MPTGRLYTLWDRFFVLNQLAPHTHIMSCPTACSGGTHLSLHGLENSARIALQYDDAPSSPERESIRSSPQGAPICAIGVAAVVDVLRAVAVSSGSRRTIQSASIASIRGSARRLVRVDFVSSAATSG